MQLPHFPKPQNRFPRVLGLVLVIAAGCGGPTPTVSGPTEQPNKGVTLKLHCPDGAFATAIRPLARAWAARTGATVDFLPTTTTSPDGVDLAVLSYAEFGTWAERGDLAAVPGSLRSADSPYQWLSVLPHYRDRVIVWGGAALGLPLAGEGHVLVYRADRLADKAAVERFAKEFNRPLAPPSTWEDFADIAMFFHRLDGKPSLPALPTDDAKLATHFFRVAACFDRPALPDSELSKRQNDPNFAAQMLSFEFRVDDGKARIARPGFELAAEWLARLKLCRGAALAEAVLAVVSLDELTQLPRDGVATQARYGVGPLPGTRRFIDPSTGKESLAPTTNYVPYIAGGKLGVVRQNSANVAAAFELLAEIGGPEGSQQIVSATGLGVGPFRTTHLDRDRLLLWLGYGFDAERSRALQEALRSSLGQQVANPVFGLRTPDYAALTGSLATELKKIAGGETTPAEGLKRVANAWDADSTAADTRLKWRRRAAGFN